MVDMVGTTYPLLSDLYYVIWKYSYSKKNKIFLWELGAINTVDRLQRQMPYMSLSSSCCLMCCHYDESPTHLFMHFSFASKFWDIIMEAFGYSMPCPNSIFDLPATLLVGHQEDDLVGSAICFFWLLWGERSGHLFLFPLSIRLWNQFFLLLFLGAK